VPEDEKQRRLQHFMQVQAGISAQRLQQRVGRRQWVLVDALEGELRVARSAAEAPEIDGVIRVQECRARPGEFIEVEILSADEHDLRARPVVKS
jgi:ribosomal protein S12 methylthiotransferase